MWLFYKVRLQYPPPPRCRHCAVAVITNSPDGYGPRYRRWRLERVAGFLGAAGGDLGVARDLTGVVWVVPVSVAVAVSVAVCAAWSNSSTIAANTSDSCCCDSESKKSISAAKSRNGLGAQSPEVDVVELGVVVLEVAMCDIAVLVCFS